MSADQKKLMGELLGEYLKNMPEDVVAERRERIRKAGMDNIYFAWWGSSGTQRNGCVSSPGADVPDRSTTILRTARITFTRSGETPTAISTSR